MQDATQVPEGFGAYLVPAHAHVSLSDLPGPSLRIPIELDYLQAGDVVRVDGVRNGIRVLYRRSSDHNSFLLTERCNHYCLMCSQPPKEVDDSWLVDEVLEALPLIDKATMQIGFTGGEPALLGSRLIDLLVAAKQHLPATAVHVLTNGRGFFDKKLCHAIAAVGHPDLMFGVPLYADVADRHDYIVQSKGAFDETFRGLLNARVHGLKLELRFVITAQNYELLPRFADFVGRSLLFVDQVSLMGLEVVGFARANLDKLWIDPHLYRRQLSAAAMRLTNHGVRVYIFNHQLCLVDQSVWEFCQKSISDWKNEYLPVCDGCTARARCGGFFATGRARHSDYLSAFS